MTNEQWEVGMQELRDAEIATQHLLGKLAERHDTDFAGLRDAQLVTQRVMQLNEKKWDERFEKLTETVENLTGTVGNLTGTVEKLAGTVERIALSDEQSQARISELQGMMNSLIANIDRFVQGRQSNGH